MADMFDKVLGGFHDLLRRSIAPSVAFIVIAVTFDLVGAELLSKEGGASDRILNYGSLLKLISSEHTSSGGIVTLTILLIIGMSYALGTLQQVLFDNRLKANFLPMLMQMHAWYWRKLALAKCVRAFRKHAHVLKQQTRALEKLLSVTDSPPNRRADDYRHSLKKHSDAIATLPCALNQHQEVHAWQGRKRPLLGKCARAFREHAAALADVLKERSGKPADPHDSGEVLSICEKALNEHTDAVFQYPCALKENASDPQPAHGLSKREILVLQQLRREVVDRLATVGLERLHKDHNAPPTDYVLYEILGGIDPTSTTAFVDSAKAMGVVFVSVILVLLGNVLLNPLFWHWFSILVSLVLVGFSYWAGYNAIAGQYRARALRLYANFLAMPESRINYLLFPERWSSASDEKESS